MGPCNSSIKLDANGNASTRNGYTVGWTSYNYPLSVTTASESVAFSYGHDRQRWKEVYTNASGTETTYHAGKLFEVAYYLDGGSVLAHYRHYVYAGNELVSIDDRSTATTPQYYVVSDHQGSFTSIENGASGASPSDFVSESFTAFGNRRNGETWSGAPTTADEANINIVSRRGYTGESALGIAMGLNHLNGRIEDAITGRFLSPDPYIPDPTNTQDFNRYSYVDNNPMSLIDPTGFDSAGGSDDSGGDSPGGNDGISPIVVYGSRGWNSYNGASGFAAFSSFGSGAVGTQLFNSYVASNSMFGALYPVNPAFDSTTFLGTNDDSNQEADLSEVSVTAQRMTDSSGPTLKEFSDRISEESADRQRLLDQSRNFTFDTRTYWQRLKDNFSRSGAKMASFGLNLSDKGLTVASFIPVADEGAILLLAAERGLAARGATTLAHDATGNIHGILPKIEDLKNASPAQIRENIEELCGSVLARKQELERLGEEGAHRARIGQEESLLRSLEGRLEDLFGAKNAPP